MRPRVCARGGQKGRLKLRRTPVLYEGHNANSFSALSHFEHYRPSARCHAGRLFQPFFIDYRPAAFLVRHVRYFSRQFRHALSRSDGGRLRESPSTCASNFSPEHISRLDHRRLDCRACLVAENFARRVLCGEEPAAARGGYERMVGCKTCGLKACDPKTCDPKACGLKTCGLKACGASRRGRP
jgi:hypothetical protein